jgi:acyl-homoserine-lactone acylase
MRLRRADVDLPGHGAFGDPLGVLHVVVFTPEPDGRFASAFGDTFIAAVEFGPVVRARVLLSYGNATQPGSPHNGDQLALLSEKALRPAWLTRGEIEANLAEVTALEAESGPLAR